jgi:hypothetical protein
MSNEFILKKVEESGMDFNTYLEMTSEEIRNTEPEILSQEEKDGYETKKLNMHRMSRIDKSYIPGLEIVNEVSRIEEKQIWMVITENWCGDSAQNLPYIVRIASLNKNIDLKIILRDSNPEIMDMYLTNGARSIPKLVVFDEDGLELFQWGARPKAAQQLVNDLKAEGFEKKRFIEKLHLWYARNKGADIESEILNLIKNSNLIKKSV